jgi:hypothetical protein
MVSSAKSLRNNFHDASVNLSFDLFEEETRVLFGNRLIVCEYFVSFVNLQQKKNNCQLQLLMGKVNRQIKPTTANCNY